MEKPKHKFFERFLDNDVESFTKYLLNLNDQILNKEIKVIPDEEVDKVLGTGLETTKLGEFYNIFTFPEKEISVLYNALLDMTKEACEYYSIDFDKEDYYINGWFNVEDKNLSMYDENQLHDHMGGAGAPHFHGYYCVNAEPSITHYKIDNKVNFENHNINNRAIVSETGHPHARGQWPFEEKRITLAYDIVAINRVGEAIDQFRNFIKFK